jgi:hypothetical protein
LVCPGKPAINILLKEDSMGTWGVKSFENDTALDWAFELNSSTNDEPIFEAIYDVLDTDDEYPDADICCCAVASAEVIAAFKGNSEYDLPDEIMSWLRNNTIHDMVKLTEDTLIALEIVQKNSELKDLWLESDDYEKWNQEIEDLIRRVS